MKRHVFLLVCAFLMLFPAKSLAQGDFFFGLTSQGQNFWFMIPQTPVRMINAALGGGAYGYTYEWISAEDSQGKVKIDNGNYFGFKAKDLFNHFGYGLTFGYQPQYSFFGIFVRGGYKFRQFRMQPDRSIEGREKYKLNSWTAGVGIRLTPFTEMLRYDGWSPILEIGTDYNKVFSCKAPYDGDTSQFGSGFSTHLALGVRFATYDGGTTLSLSLDLPHYDYFNKDFTAADGSKPYSNINSKNYAISLRLQQEF